MCRLLGIYGHLDFWQELVLEFQKLAEFGKNAPHAHGWGIAKSNEGNYAMSLLDKQNESAYQSRKYQKAVDSLIKQPEILLCHMRKASPNVPISFPNVQPFFAEKWAFIHNGTIYNSETLDRNHSYVQTSENSDSEHFFHYLLSSLSSKNAKEREIAILMSTVLNMDVEFSSINCMLSDGQDLYVIRWCTRFLNYYTLFYYKFEEALIVCSEPLTSKFLNQNNWQKIPNQSILKISQFDPKIEMLKYSDW